MSIDLSDQHVHVPSLALASKRSILRQNEYNYHFCLADSQLQILQINLPCSRQMDKESAPKILSSASEQLATLVMDILRK